MSDDPVPYYVKSIAATYAKVTHATDTMVKLLIVDDINHREYEVFIQREVWDHVCHA